MIDRTDSDKMRRERPRRRIAFARRSSRPALLCFVRQYFLPSDHHFRRMPSSCRGRKIDKSLDNLGGDGIVAMARGGIVLETGGGQAIRATCSVWDRAERNRQR